ncbi:MAG: hypothetical protein HY602_03490, partial [Parcubacteria group bacterium]|nr:hypothetical protein [Parcubacteria group bacterium]
MTAAKKFAKKSTAKITAAPRLRRQKLIPEPKKVELKSPDKKVKSSIPTTKTPLSPAASMEELLSRKQSKFFVPRRGEILRGTVTEVTSRLVLLDIGAKTEGLVVDREFDEARDFAKTLAVGDEIN